METFFKIILMFPIIGFLAMFFLWPRNDEDATWTDLLWFLVSLAIVVCWMFNLVKVERLILFAP
jgi:hypothetical protein